MNGYLHFSSPSDSRSSAASVSIGPALNGRTEVSSSTISVGGAGSSFITSAASVGEKDGEPCITNSASSGITDCGFKMRVPNEMSRLPHALEPPSSMMTARRRAQHRVPKTVIRQAPPYGHMPHFFFWPKSGGGQWGQRQVGPDSATALPLWLARQRRSRPLSAAPGHPRNSTPHTVITRSQRFHRGRRVNASGLAGKGARNERPPHSGFLTGGVILAGTSGVLKAFGITQARGSARCNLRMSCAGCGEKEGTKRCSRCKVAWYCSADCQRKAWAAHKITCKPANDDNAKYAMHHFHIMLPCDAASMPACRSRRRSRRSRNCSTAS